MQRSVVDFPPSRETVGGFSLGGPDFTFLCFFLIAVALFIDTSMLRAEGHFQPVNLNVASKDQIMVLPGVGDKLAKRIVEHREKKGQFASLDELLLIEGLRPKLLEKLSGKVEVTKTRKDSARAKAGSVQKEAEIEPLTKEDIQRLMSAFAREPKAKDVQEQALRYATAEPSRVDEWLKRARLAPSLPSLSLSGGRGIDSDASVREKLGDPSIYSKRDSADFNLNVKLEWKFADLLFNRNELYVARESFRMSVLRERILDDVNKAYFERRKAQLKSVADESMDAVARAELSLRIEELNAVLDGLTGGWFSENVANS